MIRAITSIALTVALLAISMAGPCLACPAPTKASPESGSCCHHGSCQKPTQAPAPQGCATPDLASTPIELAWTQTAHAIYGVLAPVAMAHVTAVTPRPAMRVALVDPYSPPDLCLLNSVLTV